MSIKYTYHGQQTEVESTHIRLTTSGMYLDDNIDIEAEGGGQDGFNILSVRTCFHSADSSCYVFVDGTRYPFTETRTDRYTTIVMPVLSNIHRLKFTADHWHTNDGSSDSYAYYIKEGETTRHFFAKNVEVTLDSNIHLYIGVGACLLKGTVITMADGTVKPIEEIQVGDLVMGYDRQPKRVEKCQYGSLNLRGDYDEWLLSDGTVLRTTLRHEFYNADKQKMMYLDEFNIGEHLVSLNGEEKMLCSCTHFDEPCQHFSLWCEDNLYYAGGMLCGNRHSISVKTR